MSEIKILEKPDSVSWEEINDLLHRAHESNIKKGIVYGTAGQDTDRLVSQFGAESVCLVAVDGERVIGTAGVEFRTVNKWWAKGKAAQFKLMGIDPAYKGRHIGSMLVQEREAIVRANNTSIVYTTSAEKNIIVKNMCLGNDFKMVDYAAFSANNFYSVYYAKWMDGCPFSDAYIKCRYLMKREKVRLRYKPGKIKRF